MRCHGSDISVSRRARETQMLPRDQVRLHACNPELDRVFDRIGSPAVWREQMLSGCSSADHRLDVASGIRSWAEHAAMTGLSCDTLAGTLFGLLAMKSGQV